MQVSTLVGFSIGGELTLKNLLIAPIMNGHQFIYNMGGWFIVPLFMVEIYNVLSRKLFKLLGVLLPEWLLFALNIILGLLGNSLACNRYLNDWWLVLARMLYFIPFYGLGLFYRSSLEKFDRRIPGVWYFISIFVIKLLIACIYGKMPTYTPSWCNDFTEGPIMPIIIGYLGILFWFRVASIMEPAIGRNKYINLIADNTYSIMMNHFVGFMIVKSIYATISKVTSYFSDFDWMRYKTDIWWYYKPQNLEYTLILYTIAGIVFPIIFQFCINRIKLILGI